MAQISRETARELWKQVVLYGIPSREHLYYAELIKKEQLTDKEVKEIVVSLWWIHHWTIKLDNLREITENQAAELGKWNIRHLELNWLTNLTAEVASKLSKIEHLELNWLTKISPDIVAELNKIKNLQLNWLTQTTSEEQA